MILCMCFAKFASRITCEPGFTVTMIWVRLMWRRPFCSCVWDFCSRGYGKWVATWSSRCALKSLWRHTYHIGAVRLFVVFFNTGKKKQMWFLKKRRPCVLLYISIVAISVDLPVTVNNSVTPSQVGFQQFCAIQHFCVEGSNKHSDRGHSSNDLEFFSNRTFRGSFSYNGK